MTVSLAGALLAAVFFGVASALQAKGASTVPVGSGLSGLLRIARQWVYLLGLLCDGLGFVAELVALRQLPLFVVQGAVAASLAVTAVVAVPLLGARLSRREWTAVLGVCVGLAALGVSAGVEGAAKVGTVFEWSLVGGTVLLALVGLAMSRLPTRGRATGLGFVGGLGFGLVAIAARILPGFAPGELLRDPATYALVGSGVVAFVCFTTALQYGAVVGTAGLVVGETVVPAAIGVLLLGDVTRPGYWPVAIGGFVLAVASALALGRFGEPT